MDSNNSRKTSKLHREAALLRASNKAQWVEAPDPRNQLVAWDSSHSLAEWAHFCMVELPDKTLSSNRLARLSFRVSLAKIP